MRTRVVRIHALLAVAAAVAFSGASPAAEPWITIVTGAEQHRIVDDGSEKTLAIPVRLTGVDAKAVKLKTRAVRRDTILLPELLPAFQVEQCLAGGKTATPSMQLKVNTGQAQRSGSYEVWIEANAKQAQDSRTEILKVVVDHPSAALRPPGSLLINIVRTPIRDEVEATPLKLELTSDASRLSSPAVSAIQWPQDKSVEASLELASPLEEDLVWQKPLERKWKVTGSFPPGSMEGTAEITGPQLKDPVAFKIVMKVRYTFLWLFLAAALGLWAGWYFKVRLEYLLQLRIARRDALQAHQSIVAELQRNPDPALAEAMRQPLVELDAAIRGNDATEMNNKAKAATEALPGHLETLRQAQQAAKTQIDPWLKAVGAISPRQLPEPLGAAAARAESSLRQADAKIRVFVQQALAEFEEARKTLADEASPAAARWKQETTDALNVLSDPARLILPREASAPLSERAASLSKSIESSVQPTTADVAAAASLFEQVALHRQGVQIGLMEPTRSRLKTSADAFLQELDVAPGVGDGAALIAAGTAAQGRLTGLSPEEGLRALAPGALPELTSLDARFRSLLETAKQSIPKEHHEAIDKLTDAREYVSAARALRELRKTLKRDQKLGADGKPLPLALPELPLRLAPTHEGAIVLETVDVRLTSLPEIIPPAEVSRFLVRTKAEIRYTQALQTAIAALIVLAIAYITYRATYLGTWAELIGIFFWAFSADLAVAKVLELAKDAGKAPAR